MQESVRLYDLRKGEFCRLPTSDFVLALGNFDGVHSAHRVLLHRAVRCARERSKTKLTHSAVWCFDPPSSDFLGKSQCHLTTMEEKLAAFADCGIHYAYLADFRVLRSMSPDCFIEHVLKQNAHAVHVVCGYHFRFGKDGKGNTAKLCQAFGEACVDIIPPICLPLNGQETVISASAVRSALAHGKIENATRMLGRPYHLTAPVIQGKQLGRILGFPTINQNVPDQKLLPLEGIYVTRCRTDAHIYIGVTNIGHRPTVDPADATINCETHLLNTDIDLYGKTVSVEFLHRLRDERRFDSVDLLKNAVLHDIEQAEKYRSK